MEIFYKITKYREHFSIKRKYHYSPRLELSCIKYSNVFQYRHAIIAKRTTGGYDLYLPSTKYDMALHAYTVVDCPLTWVASNISEYLTYQDIFAFQKDAYWIFLLLHNFEMELELDNDITNSLEKRLAELPRIPCEANTKVSFKTGFEALYTSDKNHLAVFHADQDYLINAQNNEIPLYDSGIKTTCLGTATMLSGGDGHFFKATYDRGEAWYHNQYSDGYLYSSIDPMKVDEYPVIYPSEDFSGYWKKNNDGIIVGLTFLSNTSSESFSLCLPCPATEVQFVKKINRTNLHDVTDMIKPAFLWKITSETGEVLFLLVSGNHYVTLSTQDFTN